MMKAFVLILPDAKAPDMLPEFRPQEKIFQVQKDSEEWGRRLEISTVGELNDQIVSQGIQKILLMQEQSRSLELPELQSRSWRLETRSSS